MQLKDLARVTKLWQRISSASELIDALHDRSLCGTQLTTYVPGHGSLDTTIGEASKEFQEQLLAETMLARESAITELEKLGVKVDGLDVEPTGDNAVDSALGLVEYEG